MEFIDFQSCVEILKDYTMTDLLETKRTLVAQMNDLEKEKYNASNEIRRSAAYYLLANEYRDKHMNEIQNVVIPTYKRMFTSQKNARSTFSKKLTVRKITENKKELERFQKTVKDNTNRVKQIAKVLMSIYQQIDKIKVEIQFVDRCQIVNDFLVANNLAVQTIIYDDMTELYKAFMRGGNW